MKALSIRGDFIIDIIKGKKTIEYRTWTTNYRGPLLLCSTAKKVHGSCPGHALCVAIITKITWNENEQIYEWHIAPFKKGQSYLIDPIHVKGQLKLFNVDDKKIHPTVVEPNDLEFKEWYENKILPIMY